MCLESLIPGTELATKWAIADSGEDAHILGVNIEESPALAEEIAWQEKEVSALCANCTFEELPVTFKDLEGGKVSSKVIAALQSNPEINYLYYGFGDIATGVPQALKGAGYADKVKQIGNNSTEAVIKELANGEQAAWANGGAGSLGATMIDPMVRLSLEEELTPEYLEELAVSPTYLVSSPEAAEALSSTEYTWPGPPDAVQQYEELWQLK
jgi:ABC-type sugar transport system substrate-binding protein